MRNERRSEVLLRLAAPHGMYVQVSLVYHKGDGYWIHWSAVEFAGPTFWKPFDASYTRRVRVAYGSRFSRKRFDSMAADITHNPWWRPLIDRYVQEQGELIDCYCG